MNAAPRLAISAALAAALLCSGAAVAAPDAVADVKGPAGQAMGTVSVQDAPVGVLLRLDLRGLAPGWHAIHFHETGACDDAKFASAGAHINHAPSKKPHGLLNADGPDFGDLPNIFASADGTAKAEVFTTFVSLKGTAGRPALLDANGSSLVVHANADDYTTQPIGGAGDRVGCAVIKGGVAGAASADHSGHAGHAMGPAQVKPATPKSPAEAAAASK